MAEFSPKTQCSQFRPSTKPSRRCGSSFGHGEAPRDRRTYACHSRATQAAGGAGVEEVARLLDVEAALKYKAALSVVYGAGLRATEVVSLKVTDIDSKAHDQPGRAGKGEGP